MKIESLRIENFRSFKDETIIFDNYTCFVGSNGSGKSTILYALNLFFRQNKDTTIDINRLLKEDFHHKDITQPIKITVTFTDLSEQAKESLSDYVRQDKLVVTTKAEYNQTLELAEVKQFGNRLGFQDFKVYFEAEKNGAKANELKEIYKNLQASHPKLPNGNTKNDMSSALREYETNNPDKCILIESEDQFYGVSKGVNRLAPHIQWVFVSAHKDATEEAEESKNSALGQLLARTVRSKVNFSEKVKNLKNTTLNEYQKILDSEQSALDDISLSLANRLESWSHPGISAKVLWKQDPDRSVKLEEPWAFIQVGERGFESDLSRFGHGLQRSYMLALLQELTTINDESAPTLIMGIEEPEIYQHPPQIKHLAETLYELSEKDSQILLCSHNPHFIPGDNFEAVRVVREKNIPSCSYVSQLSYKQLSEYLESSGQKSFKEKGILAKLYPSLNPIINEMFFCKNLILTEGIEDVAYISTYLLLTNKINEFRKIGCHIIPVGGKSEIIKPLAIARLLKIPVYIICDADTDKDEIQDENRRNSEVAKHKKDNRAILNLLGYNDINEWPETHITKNNLYMWKNNLTKTINDELGDDFKNEFDSACIYYDNPGGLNKNPLAIARALQLSWDKGLKSLYLIKLIEEFISYFNTE